MNETIKELHELNLWKDWDDFDWDKLEQFLLTKLKEERIKTLEEVKEIVSDKTIYNKPFKVLVSAIIDDLINNLKK